MSRYYAEEIHLTTLRLSATELAMSFAKLYLTSLMKMDTFQKNIVFINKASFSLNDVNSQRYRCVPTYIIPILVILSLCYFNRYWLQTIYHMYNLSHTHCNERVNIWAGIIGTIIGPCLIDGMLITNKFLDLRIIPEIQYLNIENVSFQMYWAPAQSIAAITRFPKEMFPDRWIGRFGPISWLPRSSELSPDNFSIELSRV